MKMMRTRRASGLEIIEALRVAAYAAASAVPQRVGSPPGAHWHSYRLSRIGEIGSSEKREILALGETPNIAARIQGTS